MSQQEEDLMNLAAEAGLPKEIMSFLLNNNIIANLQDLRRITPDEVQGLRSEYDQAFMQPQMNQTFGHSWLQVD